MLISNIINDSFGLLSKQLRFYSWHYRRDLDRRQRQELIDVLKDQHFERLVNKIKSLIQSNISDSRQQIGKLLFENCLIGHRRHQLIQLIESNLVDIDVRLDNYGRTLLHRTAYNLDVELVRLLIDQGVNIRLRDYAGNTALHIAIQSYRNGALIYNNELEVIQNLSAIITILLDADEQLQGERNNCKKIKLNPKNSVSYDSDRIVKRIDCTANNLADDEIVNGTATSPSIYVDASRETMNHSSILGSQQSFSHYSSCKKSTTNVQNVSKSVTDQFSDLSGSKQANHPDPQNLGYSMLMEDLACPLINTKNAFGRTPLHYCVLVVGEQHLGHILQLMISYGADPDTIDTRLKTPLYCLVKRPGVSAIRQKCLAIRYLIESGCDDLGLAIDPKQHFDEKFISNLEKNIPSFMQNQNESQVEPIFDHSCYKRVPKLKHLARLSLIRTNAGKAKVQSAFTLPRMAPQTLNNYINRKILDQSELF